MAIRLAGREVEVEALVAEVAKDRSFFLKSGGGVTFSGGEPLDQIEFLGRCIEQFLAMEIPVAIESCLAVDHETLATMLGFPIDWLVDVKHVVEDKYLRQTGGHVEQVLANLRALSKASSRVIYRVPLIPGFNDSDNDRELILEFIASLDRVSPQPPQVDILPYHDLAAGKYLQLGRANPYNRKPLAKEVLEKWRLAVAELGTQVNVGG